ncbi:unnamed protein product [Mytilus edulis]|uniref:Uncharacterized protein n=1 Tax=Mytilus edulis TaxID=6550 RepID=A0A8S3VEF1_MYTED|nr:unnamed protein product [Mytilus edulis]
MTNNLNAHYTNINLHVNIEFLLKHVKKKHVNLNISISGSALCKFPCEWIGKTFIWEDTRVPPNPNAYGTITYSKCNHSVAVLTVNVNTVDLVCLEIKGPYILLKWTTEGESFLDCLTVKIISPDVFTFIARDDADVLTCTAPPPKCRGKRRKHCKGLRRLKQCRRPGYWYSGKPSHYKYRTAKPCKKWN